MKEVKFLEAVNLKEMEERKRERDWDAGSRDVGISARMDCV